MNVKIAHSALIIFSFLIPFLIVTSCTENNSTNPVNSQANIIIDFQNGFHSDSVVVLVNNSIIFSESITTNQSKEFAKRIELINAMPNSRIKIELNNYGASIK